MVLEYQIKLYTIRFLDIPDIRDELSWSRHVSYILTVLSTKELTVPTKLLFQAPGPMVKVVKDIWKRKSFKSYPLRSSSSTSTVSSRSATRPIDGNLSTGRIKGKRVKRDKNDIQVIHFCHNSLKS